MNLFENIADKTINLLPYDGIVNYYGPIINNESANSFYKTLLDTIDWRNDEAYLFGKKYITKRKVAWYGDLAFEYAYSNVTKKATPWTKELLILKNLVEKESQEIYNSCLLNLYHSGDEGMAWHSDAEKDLKKNGAIGSISFGAERKFSFKHKETQEIVSLILEHGSLLVMKDATQTNWLHRLPPSSKVFQPRINLTFRSIVK
jgi:alkylated DNA repair dioxygenase AlkB